MRRQGRVDLLLIGLLLVVSAIFSYFKGYIGVGLGLIMVMPGSYLIASGIFDKPKEKPTVKADGLSNKKL